MPAGDREIPPVSKASFSIDSAGSLVLKYQRQIDVCMRVNNPDNVQ